MRWRLPILVVLLALNVWAIGFVCGMWFKEADCKATVAHYCGETR